MCASVSVLVVFFDLKQQVDCKTSAPGTPGHPSKQTHLTPCVPTCVQRTKPELLKGPPKKKGKKVVSPKLAAAAAAAGAGSGSESDSKKSKKDQ